MHSFNGGEGQTPHGGIVFDTAGNLYGTTRWGGNPAYGTVYESMPTGGGSWSIKVLHSFGSGTDGQNPQAGMVIDGAGNLYSTTEVGGANGAGIVFELTPGGASWTESVLHNFNVSNFTDGGYPWGGVILNSVGNLFGATPNGGGHGSGTVFEVTP